MSLGRILQQKSAIVIDRLLDDESLITFSVTKLSPDTNDPAFHQYLKALDRLLDQKGIQNGLVKFLHDTPGAVRSYDKPRICILGSQENAIQETEYLLRLLQQCPEGPILDNIEEIDKSFYFYRSPPKTIGELLADVKQEGKRVLELSVGPVCYSREELELIKELFIPSIYESPTPS
ncbi:hypothetical protein CL618_01465 [archaeon]|nr:hypothetical protein [archaeon]|tara:strand:- start:2234 stop:2764 length:531 start_codon:yes stop_codon:yes gene_type:complete